MKLNTSYTSANVNTQQEQLNHEILIDLNNNHVDFDQASDSDSTRSLSSSSSSSTSSSSFGSSSINTLSESYERLNTNDTHNSCQYSTLVSLKCHSLYNFQQKIRSGGFGEVYKGTRKIDNKPIAIKVVPKDKINLWTVNNENKCIPMEIDLMYKMIECQGCIKIIDYIERHNRYLIIMERLEKSIDLWDYIYRKGPMSAQLAKTFFKKIVQTVLEMKAKGVLHRDIKDENILVDLNTLDLKIIDFGAGTYYTDNELYDFQGTRVYSPPEWIKNKSYKGDEATVWSLGVLLHNMIYGDIPFKTDNEIVNCKLVFNQHRQTSALQDVNDLISLCLRRDVADRIKLESILEHKWFKTC